MNQFPPIYLININGKYASKITHASIPYQGQSVQEFVLYTSDKLRPGDFPRQQRIIQINLKQAISFRAVLLEISIGICLEPLRFPVSTTAGFSSASAPVISARIFRVWFAAPVSVGSLPSERTPETSGGLHRTTYFLTGSGGAPVRSD
tara:strand:- start:218 stop:661 length:444 start_codon:yes stop_codon:yes gene_type:complete